MRSIAICGTSELTSTLLTVTASRATRREFSSTSVASAPRLRRFRLPEPFDEPSARPTVNCVLKLNGSCVRKSATVFGACASKSSRCDVLHRGGRREALGAADERAGHDDLAHGRADFLRHGEGDRGSRR